MRNPPAPAAPISESSASALVHRAQRGDHEAFSQLYAAYYPKVYAYVLRHVPGQEEVARDLTSDVFMRALEHLKSYRFQEVPFTSWLYRIAHNRVIDHYRRLPKHQPVPIEDDEQLAKKALTLDLSLLLNRKVLYDAICKLTPEQRSVIVLRLIQDHSVAETARAMGRSEDAVKKLQSRALAALERMLETPSLAPMRPAPVSSPA
jgi:RNA polymerase sigma-70 factor (ECF subfamily)